MLSSRGVHCSFVRIADMVVYNTNLLAQTYTFLAMLLQMFLLLAFNRSSRNRYYLRNLLVFDIRTGREPGPSPIKPHFRYRPKK